MHPKFHCGTSGVAVARDACATPFARAPLRSQADAPAQACWPSVKQPTLRGNGLGRTMVPFFSLLLGVLGAADGRTCTLLASRLQGVGALSQHPCAHAFARQAPPGGGGSGARHGLTLPASARCGIGRTQFNATAECAASRVKARGRRAGGAPYMCGQSPDLVTSAAITRAVGVGGRGLRPCSG